MRDKEKEWRGGVYLCTAKNSFEADILESKLRSENIPFVRRYKGASNFLEIAMGANMTQPMAIYVPEKLLEDAQNVIVAVPLDECEDVDFGDESGDADFGDEDFEDEDLEDKD